MPNSFGQQPNDGIVDHAGCLAASPPMDRQGRYNPNAGVAGGAQAPPSPFGDAAWSTRLNVKDFDISYKPNNQLKVFTETVADCANWASRATDHIARHQHRWKEILTYIKLCGEQRIHKADLLKTHCDGVNAWTLANKLEAWLSDWFSTNLYNRRIQLAGGKAEEGNGFEIWRQLYRQYAGGSQVVKFGGQLRLRDWPKCTSMAKLEAHHDGWQACLDEYGTEMYAAPNMLRTM